MATKKEKEKRIKESAQREYDSHQSAAHLVFDTKTQGWPEDAMRLMHQAKAAYDLHQDDRAKNLVIQAKSVASKALSQRRANAMRAYNESRKPRH